MPACWNKLLTALNGAVANVGIPIWLSVVVTVFKGIDAKFRAPPTNPCIPVNAPVCMVATTGVTATGTAAAVLAAPAVVIVSWCHHEQVYKS